SLVTPCAVAPPLSPVNAGVQFGECPDHVNCRTPGPHFAPVLAIAEAAGAAAVAPGVVPAVVPLAPVRAPAAEAADAVPVPPAAVGDAAAPVGDAAAGWSPAAGAAPAAADGEPVDPRPTRPLSRFGWVVGTRISSSATRSVASSTGA